MDLYRHKVGGSEIECAENLGDDARTQKIADWVNADGPETTAIFVGQGTFDYDLDNAYIMLKRDDLFMTVPPGSWVIRARKGRFYVVTDKNFRSLYEKVGA